MSDQVITIPEAEPFVLLNGDKELLRIDREGVLHLGEGVTADEAARAFVDAVNELGVRT